MTDDIVSLVERELRETPVDTERITDGSIHETYAVVCPSGKYILQCSKPDENQGARLRQGLYWYRALQDSDIPVPELVTETVQTDGDRHYTLVEHLPGSSGELDISPERVGNAAPFLARIHGHRQFDTPGQFRIDEHGPVVEEFDAGSLAEWRERRLDQTLSWLADAGMTRAVAAVERVRPRLERERPDEFQAVLCHNDYTPDNVIFEGDTVTGIVDFDLAFAGHRQHDIVQAANSFWMHDPCVEWDVRATFYEGYRHAGEIDPSFERNEPLYRVETLAWTVGALWSLDGLSEYEQAFYTERIVETVERLERSA